MLLTRRSFIAVAGTLPFLLSAKGRAWGDDGETPYVQSPMDVVDRMLRLADPKPGEYLIDLGSGDGRIVIQAAKRYGARGLGVDLDPRLVQLANDNARKAGVADRARFEVRDLFETELGSADIISAYLLPEVNLQLRARILRLRPGTRIVTHDYDFGDWHYDEMIDLPVAEKLVGPLGHSKIFLFVVPANVHGVWRSDIPQHGGAWEFRIGQRFQLLDIAARAGGRDMAVKGMRLRGEELRMVVLGVVNGKPLGHAFRGQVKGDRIEGELTISSGEDERTIPWSATRTK